MRPPALRPASSYPCQGSLRQFVINATALGGEGALAQSGSGQIDGATTFLPAGFESSIFMIPSGQLSGGVAVITLAGALPAVSGANTRLDATTQTVNIGNTNIGTLGTGGTVGVDGISLPTFQRPEVQLTAGDTSVTLSGTSSAILGFALRQGYILLSGSSCLARNNLVGMTATGSSADNSGAALRHHVHRLERHGAQQLRHREQFRHPHRQMAAWGRWSRSTKWRGPPPATPTPSTASCSWAR